MSQDQFVLPGDIIVTGDYQPEQNVILEGDRLMSTAIGFSEIETSSLKSKPIVRIKKSEEKYNFIVSLSHENDFAISVVISERIK